MSNHAIEITQLTKVYGSHRALDGVDLCVPAGSFFAILGPTAPARRRCSAAWLVCCALTVERATCWAPLA